MDPPYTIRILDTNVNRQKQCIQKSVEPIEKVKISYADAHIIYDKIISDSIGWGVNICPTDLIIKNDNEYDIIQKFRHIQKINIDNTTKSMINSILTCENMYYESKRPSTPTIISEPQQIFPVMEENITATYTKMKKNKNRFFNIHKK